MNLQNHIQELCPIRVATLLDELAKSLQGFAKSLHEVFKC